jgi:hypothetical protein
MLVTLLRGPKAEAEASMFPAAADKALPVIYITVQEAALAAAVQTVYKQIQLKVREAVALAAMRGPVVQAG